MLKNVLGLVPKVEKYRPRPERITCDALHLFPLTQVTSLPQWGTSCGEGRVVYHLGSEPGSSSPHPFHLLNAVVKLVVGTIYRQTSCCQLNHVMFIL